MAKRDRQRVADMLAAAQKAIAFTHGKSRPDLDEDELLALALVRLLEIVGEAARYVLEEIKNSFPDVSWPEIAGTRNRLIHGSFAVNVDFVWAIIKNDLPMAGAAAGENSGCGMTRLALVSDYAGFKQVATTSTRVPAIG